MWLGDCYYSTCATRPGHVLAWSMLRLLRRIGALRDFRMPLDALGLAHSPLSGLMRLWSRIHWSSGDGMMPSEQLLAVYRLAATWPVRGDVVELGAWVGLTTSYLATACQARGDGTVYAVDTFEGTREGGTQYSSVSRLGGETRTAFDDQIRRAGVSTLVKTLVGDTVETAQLYPGRPIRLLLIDADHSYEGVRGDLEAWLPLVAPGGLIVFHDYLIPDVARFVDEQVRRDPRLEFEPGRVLPNVVAVTKRLA